MNTAFVSLPNGGPPIGRTDLTAAMNFIYDVCSSSSGPEDRSSRMLRGLADLLGADGAAVFESGIELSDWPALRDVRRDRWSDRYSKHIEAGVQGGKGFVSVAWVEHGRCARLSAVDESDNSHYLMSSHPLTRRRVLTIALVRRLKPFTLRDAELLRAYHGSTVARILSVKAAAQLADGLPPRAVQILDGLKRGESEKEIAERLRISRHTVHVHVKRIYSHLDVSSRAELLSLWVAGRRPVPPVASALTQ